MTREQAADRVRKLLAKAESTTFPAEADALREKALSLCQAHGLGERELFGKPDPPTPSPPDWPFAYSPGDLMDLVGRIRFGDVWASGQGQGWNGTTTANGGGIWISFTVGYG